jgi:hypothetical protein
MLQQLKLIFNATTKTINIMLQTRRVVVNVN